MARLDASKVLVVVSLWRCTGERPEIGFRWARGEPPVMAESPLELLRVEFDGPAAARRDVAERALRGGLRKVAEAMGLVAPAAQHLRQILVEMDGRMVATMGVPRGAARNWLCGSGCEGVFVRPLWTEATAADLRRDCFRLLFLRGRRAAASKIWAAFHTQPGFVGLVAEGKDVAVRVTPETNTQQVHAQLMLALGAENVAPRMATPGKRWWKLGPLTDAELWRAREMLADLGLQPLNDELRTGRMGPFRSCVFVAAVGEPRRRTFDDGSWGASAAVLQEAEPPPRRSSAVKSGMATAGFDRG